MKLFWKAQTPLLLFYSIQVILVPLLYWLTGEGRPFSIVLYGCLLSTVVLILYLSYHYYQHRKLYQRLEIERATEEELLQKLDEAPLSVAVEEMLRRYHRDYKQQLQEQQSRMDQHLVFMNRWVHQMKTPLSVMQLLLQELEESEQLADSMQEELERLRKGLEMVMYTARLDQFEHDFSIESIELCQIVHEVVASNRKLFIRKGITLELQVREGLHVYSDAKWLRFLVDQLVVNAVNYTVGLGKQIKIAAEELGESCRLTIEDEGIGIAKEDMLRVFQPYYTGERGREYHESTGMGLYLVKEVCGRLGHEVLLQSKPEVGTMVTLKFKI